MSQVIKCPSCREPMEQRALARRYLDPAQIDICFHCHGIWFDQGESGALAPGAVIELFRQIHQHRDQERRPLASRLTCTRCTKPLAHTHDMQRTTRFNYYRCAAGHGRFTTFLQFLREKHFMRDLSRAELDQLKLEVKQIHCSGCGAPVDLMKRDSCGYCQAPISYLDPGAVERALRSLQAEDMRLTDQPSQEAAVREAKAAEILRQDQQRFAPGHILTRDLNEPGVGRDLLMAGLGALASILFK